MEHLLRLLASFKSKQGLATLMAGAMIGVYCTNLHALEFAVGDNTMAEINARIQANALDGSDCDIGFCDEYESGIRLADFEFKLRYFADSNLQFYAGLDLELSAKRDEALAPSSPRFSAVDRMQDSAEDDTIEQAYLGVVFKKVGLELGELDPATSAFGVSNTNFLGYSLNAFNDDRAPEYDLFKLEGARVSFLHHKFNVLIGVANGDRDSGNHDVDHEVLANFVIPRFSWIKAQVASRRVVDNVTNVESDSYGVRLSAFSKYGLNFGLGYSKNELGGYSEFVVKWIYKHRHQMEAGLSRFRSDLSAKVSNTRNNIRDLDFWYLNYAFTVSKSLRAFVEVDQLKGSGTTLDSLIGGIEITF